MNILSKITFLKPILIKLSKILNRRQKIYLGLLLIFTIGFSLIETIGVSIIMPFISLASDPEIVNSGIYKKVFEFLGFSSVIKFIISMGIAIIFFYVLRSIYSVILTWHVNKFSLGLYKYFSMKIFKTYLSISYKLYTQKNSAVLMQSIFNETNDFSKFMLFFLNICSEFLTVIMVYTVIIIINWKMTITITAILLLIVFFLLIIMTKINKVQGEKRVVSNRKLNKILKETFGNIKFIKLKCNEENVLRSFGNSIEIRTKAEVINNVLGSFPKNILESIGFSFLVAVIVFILWAYNDVSKVIPIITLYALALYRILPSIHKMLQNFNNMVFSEKIIDSIYENLHQKTENEGTSSIQFNNSIVLDNIYFKYLNGNEIIKGVSFKIKKGDKFAITGESGCGKSTLIDIITGIHKPFSGKILIDGEEITDDNIRSWRKKIGYIPQNIYLFDGTVAENVAFGSEFNENKIITALKKANIWEFLNGKDGINTNVGDEGIQLSGGQQQRIGIARALYEDPEILVLDEATSALDTETEQKIMEEIYTVSTNKTLLIIAHRLSTVERCDRKIRMEDGKIIEFEN